MMKYFIFLLILLGYNTGLKAQNSEEYNKIYTNTYLDISQKDFPRALKIADSLFSVSETPRFKAKSLMLSASLYQQAGDIKKSVDYAVRADQVIKDNDDFIWKAKISGFLATQYRNLGLFDQSKNYINESLKAIKEIHDPHFVNQTMGFVKQEEAYYEIEMKNYRKSIASVESSQKYFESSGQNNPFLFANNDQLFGLNYYKLKEYDKALAYYSGALDKLNKMPDNFLKALVLNGIAQVYIGKKDVHKAKKYIDQADSIAEKSPYLNLKNEVFKTSQEYYILVKDIEKLQENKVKQDSVIEKIADKNLEFINHSYSGLEKKKKAIEVKSKQKNVLLILFIILLLSGVIYFVIYRRHQKKTISKIKQILKEMDQMKNAPVKISIAETWNLQKEEDNESEDNREYEQQAIMSPITEKKILSGLDKFEQTLLYTRNTVSLPYLASYCNTNIKYLSHIINTYKQKDFNNYINELRIKYIIEKLKNDPQYHKYKISTLAEEAGFSSQSKFAAAFKKVTTVSPSEFLKHIKNNQ